MARKLRRQRKEEYQESAQKAGSSAETEAAERRDAVAEESAQAQDAGASAGDHASAGDGVGAGDGGSARPGAGTESLAAEYLDQLQRLKAEFDNYRRRVAREKEEWFRLARAEVMAGLLPVLDDLRRAREHSDGSVDPLDAQGLLLILKRFEDILAQIGLEEQDTRNGLEFDPEVHEAVLTEPSAEVPEGCIVRILEPGYSYDGRMLRPGKVSVSSGRPPE